MPVFFFLLFLCLYSCAYAQRQPSLFCEVDPMGSQCVNECFEDLKERVVLFATGNVLLIDIAVNF
jgi:hypothetical protein